MNLKECYSAAGADYEAVMRRFMSEERVDRFLKMFLNDRSYQLLCEAMGQGDYEEAFRQVHTLKGICMNLDLSALLEACVNLTDNLRSGSADTDTAHYFEKTKETYIRTSEAISEHLK